MPHRPQRLGRSHPPPAAKSAHCPPRQQHPGMDPEWSPWGWSPSQGPGSPAGGRGKQVGTPCPGCKGHPSQPQVKRARPPARLRQANGRAVGASPLRAAKCPCRVNTPPPNSPGAPPGSPPQSFSHLVQRDVLAHHAAQAVDEGRESNGAWRVAVPIHLMARAREIEHGPALRSKGRPGRGSREVKAPQPQSLLLPSQGGGGGKGAGCLPSHPVRACCSPPAGQWSP